MKHINSREEMIATLLQIAYDSNLVGAIKEDVHSWNDSLNWMLDLTKTQQATLETDFVTQCLKLAQTLMTEKELEISEHDPLELLNHKDFNLKEILYPLSSLYYNELKETTDLALDNSARQVESLMNELHDANETIYQYASDPKREKLANEIINLKAEKEALVKLANNRYDEIEKLKASDEITQANFGEALSDSDKLESQNETLTKALKNSLSQIAYLVETVKTFDADFFKIKDFNNS